MKKIVFGVLAHVDSGKTTLSEAMLYKSGFLRTLGRVDHGDAFLDTHAIERSRGITIFSKQAIFEYGGTEFTLLDTPGHTDFSAETERALTVLDYAVLVISGTDGVQSHTETLWQLLARYDVPTFVFVNKTDLPGIASDDITAALKKSFGDGFVRFDIDAGEASGGYEEELAMCDEDMLEAYLGGEGIKPELMRRAIKKRNLFPCYFGSALKLDGVENLLDGLSRYTEMPNYKAGFAARIYKISQDERGERLAHMKITGGELRVKDSVSAGGKDEKINAIRVYSGGKFKNAESVGAGTVCAVTGLSSAYAGEGLGLEKDARKAVLSPMLSYTVKLPEGADIFTAAENLRILEREEPQLKIITNEHDRSIKVRLMGEIQLEVLRRIIHDRFNMDVEFEKGTVAYRETIKNIVEGVGHYEPLRHYAEVHLLLEPGKPGSGIKIASNCSEDKLDKNWQRLILTHIAEKTHLGVLTGSPVTDIKITLVSGRAHKKHTEGGDFRQATYRAIRQGLRTAQSVVLEPWYSLKLELPRDCAGRAMSDIQSFGGEIEPPEIGEDTAIIKGTAPVSDMLDYPSVLAAYSGGKGKLSCIPCGYRPCRDEAAVIETIGYDCDADTENTADSVFCSHGAGYRVPWDEVYEHMHLESELMLREKTERQAAARAYVSRVCSDKELMKIFEKTYGPIKTRLPDEGTAPRIYLDSAKTPKPQKKPQTKPRKPRDKYLLVDGYNIIFAWDELREYAKESLDLARTRLADIMCNYCGVNRCSVILVFDAYKVKDNPGEVERYHNIDIVYTKEKETADAYIEKTAHTLSREHSVRVATSDGPEQMIIFGGGALRITAGELRAEVKEAEDAIRAFINTDPVDLRV